MKLDDLFEGARDLEHRTLVASILDVIAKELRGRAPDRVSDVSYPQIIASYDTNKWNVPEELREHFSLLTLRFRAVPGADKYEASYQYGSPKDYINLYIPVPSQRTVEQWEQTVKANAAYWIKRHHEMFFHEIVHMLDQRKYKDPEYYNKNAVTTDDQPSYQEYVNSPHELNAYFQTAIAQFEKKLGTEIDPKKVAALSTQELVKLLWYPLSKITRHSLRKDSWKRFVKRVTQLHNDIKQKYS